MGADGLCSVPWGTVKTAPLGSRTVFSGRLAQRDAQLSIEHQEELIGVVVDVPKVLALHLRDAHVVVVDPGDDAGAPQYVEGGQCLVETDGFVAHD